MSENLLNMETIKDLTGLGKNLMDMAGMGKKLSEDEINNKPMADLGLSASMFTDLADMGNKLRILKELSSILGKLGISKETIDKGLKMATSLASSASKGQESLEKSSKDSLADIGLGMDMFKDMDSLGSSLNDLSKMAKLIPSMSDDKKDPKKMMDGLASAFNMIKK